VIPFSWKHCDGSKMNVNGDASLAVFSKYIGTLVSLTVMVYAFLRAIMPLMKGDAHMKLYAISDLHLDYEENVQALKEMPSYPQDWPVR
jgi:hypothetical protein